MSKPCILLLHQSPEHAALVREALKSLKDVQFMNATDGDVALTQLAKTMRAADPPEAAVLVLGIEPPEAAVGLVRRFKDSPRTRAVPVLLCSPTRYCDHKDGLCSGADDCIQETDAGVFAERLLDRVKWFVFPDEHPTLSNMPARPPRS